jgi:uncharacterized protein DUF4431
MKSSHPNRHDFREGVTRAFSLPLRERLSVTKQFNFHSQARHSCPVKTKKLRMAVAGLTIPFALSILLLAQASAQPEDWLSYYPSVSRLQGKLTKVFKYGKPTYGDNPEKDEKVEVPILIVQTPVRVRARTSSSVNNESLTNVSFVQLIFPPEVGANYAKYLDKDIVVAGTLARGNKGDHFTEVIMTVKAVNPTGKPL